MDSKDFPEDLMIQSFLENLSLLLTNDRKSALIAFRLHNKQLRTLGDLSFALNLEFSCWKHLSKTKNAKTIFEYATDIQNKEVNEETIPELSKFWPVLVTKGIIIKENCHLFLQRSVLVGSTIRAIESLGKRYGQFHFKDKNFTFFTPQTLKCRSLATSSSNLTKKSDNSEELNLNPTELRLLILKNVLEKLTHNENKKDAPIFDILITNKTSDKSICKHILLCGSVLSANGQKEDSLKAQDLYEEFSSNMRMMFEHKYGLRNISSQPNWREKVDKLGHAAVTLQMLQNHSKKTISLSSKHHIIKDAAFILYNYARISTVIQRFEQESSYSSLPHIREIDFSLLKLDEEWELIYAYLLRFPEVIKKSVEFLGDSQVNVHQIYEFLVSLSSVFSAYYSRIKILTEPMPHLFATIFARIYLLKAVQQVLSNGLYFLNIEPVSYM